ncbi:sister chromatid cohesion protein 1 [Marasmius tenuissimus]|uniref:Sister chromatid cohesion protein 1 n=1 Tax=Marasmius tenuissimus TaxID=585030 RepID=A0ABR3A5F6_9AGAR|nr:sister chromatid cohesion protein 1 [Marasmius tenuissimus]
MYDSKELLSRRGPLGKVWLAAHMERKLSKTQTLQTDITESVDAIIDEEVEFMALRYSGQLLLGVVRIYSRKAKYLLDDCNEALLKIKLAFRPGIVDMNEEQLVASRHAITIQGTDLPDLDLYIPDINWQQEFEERQLNSVGQHQARIDDITLPATDNFEPLGFDMNFDIGPSDGIGSQDFEIDLGLDFGDAPNPQAEEEEEHLDSMSVDGSIGVGRDANLLRDSIGAQFDEGGMDLDLFSNRSKSREPSEHGFGADMNVDVDIPLEGVDLGDFGVGFDDMNVDPLPGLPADGEQTPALARSPSRASSPLSDVPPTPPPIEVELPTEETPKASKLKKKLKEKKQVIDSVTELQDGGPGGKAGRRKGALGGPQNKDISDILIEPHFLPRSTIVMRLMEIHNDPLSHFLPTKVTPNGTFLCAAPPGLAPELTELFMRPVGGTAAKRRGQSPGKGSNKRPRLDEGVNENEPEEVEVGRRDASLAPSVVAGSEILGRASVGPDAALEFPDQSMGVDDFQLNVPEFEDAGVELPIVEERARSKSAAPSALSRMSTPGPGGAMFDEGEESYADASCPIAMFDSGPLTQTQHSGLEEESVDTEDKGYSKNTVKALSVIRRELRPVDGEEEERFLSFEKMAGKASRRAAASFFFELLVLTTRDCIKVTQAAPFENIEVRAKDKLWDQQHQHRGESVAPSRLPSVAPTTSSRAPSVARSIGSALGL